MNAIPWTIAAARAPEALNLASAYRETMLSAQLQARGYVRRATMLRGKGCGLGAIAAKGQAKGHLATAMRAAVAARKWMDVAKCLGMEARHG